MITRKQHTQIWTSKIFSQRNKWCNVSSSQRIFTYLLLFSISISNAYILFHKLDKNAIKSLKAILTTCYNCFWKINGSYRCTFLLLLIYLYYRIFNLYLFFLRYDKNQHFIWVCNSLCSGSQNIHIYICILRVLYTLMILRSIKIAKAD